MPVNPYIPDRDVLEVEIHLNGKNNGLHSLLKKAEVNYVLNKIPMSKFTFVGANPNTCSGKNSESPLWTLEVNAELAILVREDGELKTLFSGVISSLSRKLIPSTGFEVKIECKDRCKDLTSQQEVNANETFGEKAERFFRAHDIENGLDLGGFGEERVTKTRNISPWDYILSYTDSLGYLSRIRKGVFETIPIVYPRKDDPNKKVSFTAQNDTNLFEFGLNETEVIDNVQIQYWNPKNQAIEIVNSTTEADFKKGSELIDLGMTGLQPETILQIAQARAAKNGLTGRYGMVRTFGNLKAQYGEYLALDKVNQKLDGQPLLITEERHVISGGNWSTTYHFGLEDGRSFAQQIKHLTQSNSATAGKSNASPGLQIGIVANLADDPDGEFRILVQLPAISADSEGIWARWSALQAGGERGGFFLPQIGDEVLVGYLNDDPDTPVVLGSLYSSANQPPFSMEDDSNMQGIVTREGSKLVFNDEDKSIEISTKGGNKLMLSDKEGGISLTDQNGNKLEMNSSGITLESAMDVNIKATGNINLEGVQQALKASAIMELSGSIIKLN